MSDFKVGDAVRYVGQHPTTVTKRRLGQTGVVTEVNEETVAVEWERNDVQGVFKENVALLDAPTSPEPEAVRHPAHYGGDAPYEVIKVAEAWDFDKDAYLFNVLKYIARHESKGNPLEDLKKALWYLERKIARLEDALG